MLTRLRSIVASVTEWLMQPVRAAKDTKQRLLFRALRSRFFLLVAVLSAVPVLASSLAATYKATHSPDEGFSWWLAWVVAALSWGLFLLTVAYEYRRLTRKKRNDQHEA